MEKLVVATKNQGKLREVKALLADYPLEVLSLKDFPGLPEIEETGSTFAENALIKATTVAKQTGLLTLGDDSGLEVDCLDGRPGVLSARFAGEPASDWRNDQKLLALMAGIAPEKRTARFRCVVAIVEPTGQSYLAEGTCEGRIGYAMVGDQGFGYDPLFIIPESGLTLAQLDMASKNKISHRSQALKQAIPILLSILKR